MGKEIIRKMGDKTAHLCLPLSFPSPSTTTIQYIAKRTTRKNAAEVNQENMSESCGSNAFPNAEVEKRKTNKKHTVDVEDEVLSTNQKPYKLKKMTGPSHWPETEKLNIDSQPVQETEFTQKLYSQSPWPETEKLNIDSQPVQETEFTQKLYSQSPWLETQQLNLDSEPVLGTQLLCTQDKQPEGKDDLEPNMDFINDCTQKTDLITDENLVSKILTKAKDHGIQIDVGQHLTYFEATSLAEKLYNEEKITLGYKQIQYTFNYVVYQFHEYCKKMAGGVDGLVFDFDDGTFYSTYKKSTPNTMWFLQSNLANMYKDAIMHYRVLKIICRDTHSKYLGKHSSSISLNLSRRSSSGKRKSSSMDTAFKKKC